MKQNNFPPGWDDERVLRALAHYVDQTEADAVAEDEAAFVERPSQETGTSMVSCLEAIAAASLKPRMPWVSLKAVTREP